MTVRLRPADKGWVVLWAWVFVFNTGAAIRQHRGDEGCELLSEACQRYMSRQRWPVELWLLAFYLHLSRHVPARLDPVHWVDALIRWLVYAPGRRRRSRGVRSGLTSPLRSGAGRAPTDERSI